MDIIKTGQTWVIRTGPILDALGARLTGLTDIEFSVSRYTSGAWQWLDFADATFKASPGTLRAAMTAVDATKAAGVYGYALDMSAITNVTFGDQLFVDIQQTALTNAVNANQGGEGVYGYIVDKVEANLTVATSTLATSAALATAQGNITSILAFGAPPTAVAISDVVRAGVTTDHGAGSYLTASGFATPTTIADAVEEIEAFGQVNWVTATGFATPGAAMTLAAGALTSTAIGAGYVAAMQAGLALEATLTAMKGASFDGATDSLRASRVLVSALPAAVWATAHGTPSVDTFGWLVWRHAQWGTEIADKAIVGQDLLLRSLDLATTYATVRLRDKDGGVITPATGEPARFDPT